MTPDHPLPRFIVRYIAVVVSVTALITAYTGWKNSNDLQESLIEACQSNRAPLQVFFEKQLEQSRRFTIKQYQESFPGFDAEEIAQSIVSSRRNLKHLLETYDPAKCEAQYS